MYSSDGTVGGTTPFFPGDTESEIPYVLSGFTPVGEAQWLFFGATAQEGEELWSTDGTTAGTRLLASLRPGPEGAVSGRRLGQVGSAALFLVDQDGDPRAGDPSELWVSDGTEVGTEAIAALPYGFIEFLNQAQDDRSLFLVRPAANSPTQIWVTDGTEAGTGAIPFAPFGESSFNVGRVAGLGEGWVLSLATPRSDGEPNECGLFVSDGTGTGTRPILDLNSIRSLPPDPSGQLFCPSQLASLNGKVYFVFDDGKNGQEVWVTDGTEGGTRRITDLAPGEERSTIRPLSTWQGELVFVLSSETARNVLYLSDGTAAGTRRISDRSSVHSFAEVGEKLYFVHDTEDFLSTDLRSTEGSPASEQRIVELARSVGSSSPTVLLPFGDHLLFGATREDVGRELWRSDGTEAGTVPLDLTPGRQSTFFTSSLKVFGDSIYFEEGTRIFATDGTVEGTRAVVSSQSFCCFLSGFSKIGDRLLFSGSGDDFEHGTELWVTDETPEGAEMILDIYPGRSPDPEYPGEFLVNSSYPDKFQQWNDLVLFTAENEALGRELWVTDGTRAGTRVLETTIGPNNPEFSDPGFIFDVIPMEDRVFFNHSEGGLWVTDGTQAGTVPIMTGAGEQLTARHIVELRGRVLVIRPVSSDATTTELWSTDGSPEGTRLVTLLPSGFRGIGAPVSAAGRAFFSLGTEEAGSELWASDGTAAGTHMVKDLYPGPESSAPTRLQGVDGVLMFTAEDRLLGREIWVSDGTAEGTRLVADIQPGKEGSSADSFTSFRGQIFFTADREDVGRELFSLDASEIRSHCTPSSRRLCLQEGRFSVEVDWRNQRRGTFGTGGADPHSEDTGFFTFFNEENVELVVKMLDGRTRNERFWYFSGALSDVEYWITVLDHETGRTRTYRNPPGNLCGRAETRTFGDQGDPPSESTPGFLKTASGSASGSSESVVGAAVETLEVGALALGTCEPSPNALLLRDGRFAVEVEWQTRRQGGRTGEGSPVPRTDASGTFWFFNPDNLELVVKVLDGRANNDHFWVLYGALSDVAYQIRVTDTTTCTTRVYTNAEGNICGRADIRAFQ